MSKRKIVFEVNWFNVESEEFDDVPALNGKPFYRVNTPDSVLVVALTPKSEIVLVKQFRPATHQLTLEFPAGCIESGETPEKAAVRELYEETGYRCEKLRFIQCGGAITDRLNTKISVFFGESAVLDPAFRGESGIDVELRTPQALKELALQGEFFSLPSFGAILITCWRLGISSLVVCDNEEELKDKKIAV